MRSQALIKTYLDTLRELTQAESINLFFPANPSISQGEQIIQSGEQLLAEFQDPSAYLSMDILQDAIDGACGSRILDGHEPGTVLVSLSLSIENQSATPDSTRRKPMQKLGYDSQVWIGLAFKDQQVPQWLCTKSEHQTLSEDDSRLCSLFNKLIEFGSLQLGQLESQGTLLTDPLTNLPCRTKFQSQVGQLFKQHARLAILMVHTSEFHHINKKFGHESGDKVIWEISQNLNNCIRQTDLISRFGGALFAVAIAVNEEQEAVQLAQKIQQALQKPEYLGGAVTLGFNIGIGTAERSEPYNSQTERVAAVINKADQALKAAQSQGSPTITLWAAGTDGCLQPKGRLYRRHLYRRHGHRLPQYVVVMGHLQHHRR